MTTSLDNQPKTQLTDQHLQQIHEALLSAFAFDELRMLTRLRLETDLEAIVPVQGRNLTAMAYDLIRVMAARAGGLAALIAAAGAFAPGNPLIGAMVTELGGLAFEVLPLPERFAGGKVVHGDEVHGDKFEGDKVAGDKFTGDKIVNIYQRAGPQPFDEADSATRPARFNEVQVPTDKDISVNFFTIQETAHFTNKPGRYGDQIKFKIVNNSSGVVDSFTLKFHYPKLETKTEVNCYRQFRKVVNSSDFEIEELGQTYKITYRSNRPLLPDESFEPGRAFIIYSMDLPDKEKWLEFIYSIDAEIAWTLFSSTSRSMKGTQSVLSTYIGKTSLVKQDGV